MTSVKRLFVASLMVSFAVMTASCSKGSTSTSSSGSSSSGDTDTTLTTTNLDETWTSSCFSGTDPITSADHYLLNLSMSNSGSFTYAVYWYTGTCTPPNYAVVYESYGTYSIGSVSSSSNLQPLTFTATSSDMMAFSTAVQTSVNSNCGGTSPYNSGVSSTNDGVHKSTYMMTCSSQTFPNSGNSTVNNVAYMSGTTLYIGSPYNGIPGVFTSGTTPTTATISFTY